MLDLPARQRLKLAEVLLVSTDAEIEEDAETAWNTEIRDRITAIDAGRESGVSLEEVMAEADKMLAK